MFNVPLMRFASSTEARSTTPCADIDDIVFDFDVLVLIGF